MTAVENVAIPLEFAGHTAPFEAARAALAKVKLDHRLHHYPDQLSGGEQQRVAIARAFVVGPQLLLADEPTGNLDGATGETVIDLLFELQALHGATLCLITHDRALAARCDRTISLADGRCRGRRSDAADGRWLWQIPARRGYGGLSGFQFPLAGPGGGGQRRRHGVERV